MTTDTLRHWVRYPEHVESVIARIENDEKARKQLGFPVSDGTLLLECYRESESENDRMRLALTDLLATIDSTRVIAAVLQQAKDAITHHSGT